MIKVRQLEESDIPLVQKYISDPSIGKMSCVPSPYPDDGALAWYKFVNSSISKGKALIYTIESNGNFAGIVSLNEISSSESRANVDYWVRADLHGQGVGTRAVNEVIKAAGKIGIFNYFSSCLVRNIGSKKVLLNNGFIVDKTIKISDGKHEGEEMFLLSKVCT